jgi:4-carboxymuconolactone decarboxylase
MTDTTAVEQNIEGLARGEAPVLETLAAMTVDTFERSGLDPQTYLLVRLAALIAMDAAPASYLMHLGAAQELGVRVEEGEPGIPLEKLQAALVAIAPVVGSARVVSAAGKLARMFGLAEALVTVPGQDEGS